MQYTKLLIPFLGLLLIIGIANFCDGFLKKFKSINKVQQDTNPYVSEMFFDNEEQKNEISERWFIPQSKQVVIYIPDGLPYFLVTDLQKQKEQQNSNNDGEQQKYIVGRFQAFANALNKYPSETLLLRSKVENLSVTTDCLKTYGTGVISGVLDIDHQIATEEMTEDNIFKHFKAQNEKSIVLGTDIWISFFGKDIDYILSERINPSTLDENSPIITQEVIDLMNKKENLRKDWNLLLFHDSSFDDVGHKYASSSIPDKYNHTVFNAALKQIDEATQSFIDTLQDKDTTLIVMSDHGRDIVTASHGGPSQPEKGSVFFAYNKNGFMLNKNLSQIMDRETLDSQMNQIDFLPTFCMLKGIAIPANNIGAIVPDIILNLPWVTNTYILNAYYTNVRQIEDFIKESYEIHKSPSLNELNPIFEAIEKAKQHYLFQSQEKKLQEKESSDENFIYQSRDEEVAKMIQLVRLVSSMTEKVYYNDVKINKEQMVISISYAIVTTICIILAILLLDKILEKQLQPYILEEKIMQKQTKIVIACFLSIVVVYCIFFTNQILQALNIVAFAIVLVIICLAVSFLRKLPITQSPLVQLSKNNLFTFRFDFQTLIFLVMASIFSIIFISDDLIKSIDSNCLVVTAVGLFLMCLHSLFNSIYYKNYSFFQITLRGISIILLIHLTNYYDPRLTHNMGIGFSKLFVDYELVNYFEDSTYLIYLPLLFFAAFYLKQVLTSIKFLNEDNKQLDSTNQKYSPQFSAKLIIALNSILYMLCACYFLFRKDNLEYEYFFTNFFPISSLILIILQVVYFQIALSEYQAFTQKYSLFYWSLLPFFLYFMGENSIFQVTSFFIVVNMFIDVLKKLNYRLHLFTYLFITMMSFTYYCTSGKGFKMLNIQLSNSHIGMLWYNDFQYAINIWISNFTWFILTPLFIPILLSNEVIHINSQNDAHLNKFVQVQTKTLNIEMQMKTQQINLSQMQKDEEASPSINNNNKNNNINENNNNNNENTNNNNNKNSDEVKINMEQIEYKSELKICSLFSFQIKMAQNVFILLLCLNIGFIPDFMHNIQFGYTQFSKFLIFGFMILSSTIIFILLTSSIFMIFSKNMYNSIMQRQQKQNLINFNKVGFNNKDFQSNQEIQGKQ